MKNKYLIIPTKIETKKYDFVEYLYPLKSYCVGFLHEYELDEIPNDAYVYVNRIFDTKSIEEFKMLLPSLAKKKGILFEDLGVYELTKDLKLQKILWASHANCSSYTINTYLKWMDSVVISPDITKEECLEILKKAKKPILLYTYGPLPYMYSRRELLTNFARHFELEEKREYRVREKTTTKGFYLIENEYGTVVFDEKVLDGRELLGSTNVFAYLINLDWMEEEIDIEKWLKDFESLKPLPNTTEGFLHQKTIYRLPPKEVER